MADTQNAFAATTGEDLSYAAMQHGEYGAPSLQEGAPYIREFGWAYRLPPTPKATETPSAQRLQTIPLREFYSYPNRPSDEWYDVRDADEKRRESDTEQRATAWEEDKGAYKRLARNPRETPPEEPRPTSRLAPRQYTFLRFWDQLNRRQGNDPLVGTARTLNGNHFSMADHRRNYEVLGMAPARTARNTYRMEPTPWDVNQVDMPPEVSPPDTRLRAVEIPMTGGTRSWRL